MLAVLGLAALNLPVGAAAKEIPTPKIAKFAVKLVPIRGLKRTGNILKAGAALEVEYEFEGSGYGATAANPKGRVPPLSALNLYFPRYTRLDTMGFPTCTEETLEKVGTSGCPTGSVAGWFGSALTEMTFGTARVHEKAPLRGFFAPGGGLLFFAKGSTPAPLKVVSSGDFVPARQPYSEEFKALVPPVKSARGAASPGTLASVKRINVTLSGAWRRAHRPKYVHYFIRLPFACPRGGFPFKTEVTFGGDGYGIPAKVATALYKTHCPHKRAQK